MKNKTGSIMLISALILGAAGPAFPAGQDNMPACRTPILLTSCGQSPGPEMLKVILKRLKLDFELVGLATDKDLRARQEAGNPVKALIVVMGASLKGMGAAGISMDDELRRTAALIDEARRRKITVIGAHIEGMKRRSQGAAAGDTTDEQSIDAVAPRSDLLIVNREGNADRRFTGIATEKKIPLIEVEKNLDLLAELEKLFGGK
jgi:hypothetical protein